MAPSQRPLRDPSDKKCAAAVDAAHLEALADKFHILKFML
jgi:hypothetical protein